MPSTSPPAAPTNAATNDLPPKMRCSVPEPVETTSKSSTTASQHSPDNSNNSSSASSSIAPAAPAAVRRFTPQPLETTTKSSRNNTGSGDGKPATRRFAPQPVETSRKSSKEKSRDRSGSGLIRFKPQLVETAQGGNRCSSSEQRVRKFVPEVLSTAKRSRRVDDPKPARTQDYKTEEGHLIHAREHQKHAGWKTPTESHEGSADAKREVAPLDGRPPPRPAAIAASRSHSFRCPDLDTIESSESERDSGPSSLSSSPGRGSPITASDSSFNEFYKHATRIRESIDENFAHYFLQLEAKRAERRLQEQALAAFPNSDFHEPVRHYVNDDDDSVEDEIEDRPVTWEGFDEEEFLVRVRRRESTSNIPWEQSEMQRYAEQAEQERNVNKSTGKKEPHNNSPWWNPVSPFSITQTDSEMRSMRDRARPPMLGHDLVFARCPSPEPARFDVTQGADKLRQQMHNLSNASQGSKSGVEGGLWSAAPKQTGQSQSSAASKGETQSTTGKGLWGGFCVGKPDSSSNAGGLVPPLGPTGLMTPGPRPDNSNPFDQSFATRNGGGGPDGGRSAPLLTTPPTPPHEGINGETISQLDAVLNSERAFEESFEREYPDSFVTQVYNYLSLGYPSLARPFDEELSKIARIPISELRQDDVKAKQSPRGYIRLDPDVEADAAVAGNDLHIIQANTCVRWQALKLYVREWARQEKNMVRIDVPGGNWATTNRRGSWAI